jgi:Peptidase family M23
MRRPLLVLLVAVAAAAHAPAALASYGWPIKPFGRQHAIRGYFNDPRRDAVGDGESTSSFHFGIDVAARAGIGVYAVAAGVVSRHPDHVTVRTAEGRDFGYWHIAPVVEQGQRVDTGTLLGRIVAPWNHVHFAESVNGVYLNPLRPGALAPYTDTTSPTVASISIARAGRPVDLAHVNGVVDLTCDAYDIPPLAPPPPWRDTRVTPVLIRWAIFGAGGRRATPWRTAIDFRTTLLPSAMFNLVYAPTTKQNRAHRPGSYDFYLDQGWSSARLPNGSYRLRVRAWDSRANEASASLPFAIANGVR